jgi:hypothetical protein
LQTAGPARFGGFCCEKSSFSGESPLTFRACLAGNYRYTIGPTRFDAASNIGFYKKCDVTERGAPCSESKIPVIAGGNHTSI